MAVELTSRQKSKERRSLIGMGQIGVESAPECLHSVLGSCVGLVLYHPRLKVAALAHIVLPESAGRSASPGKFADTALPHMIRLLGNRGVNRSGLKAKIAGGAEMFGKTGPLKIGAANIMAVTAGLEEAGIPLVASHVGGKKGRRVCFDCSTLQLTIEIIGQEKEVI